MTLLVHKDHNKYDVYIGRPSRWGNPYRIGRDGTRDQVNEKYRAYLKRKIKSGEVTKLDLIDLDNKVLACYCTPRPCHGDVLIKAIKWAVDTTVPEEYAKPHAYSFRRRLSE